MKKIVLILSLLVLFACGESNQLSDEQFIQVYKEILIARESTPDVKSGTEKVTEIFVKNGISEPEFRKMYMKLSAENPKKLAAMIDSVRHQVEVEIHKINSTKKTLEMKKDTNATTQTKK